MPGSTQTTTSQGISFNGTKSWLPSGWRSIILMTIGAGLTVPMNRLILTSPPAEATSIFARSSYRLANPSLISFGFTSSVSTTSPKGANPAFVKGATESDSIVQTPINFEHWRGVQIGPVGLADPGRLA